MELGDSWGVWLVHSSLCPNEHCWFINANWTEQTDCWAAPVQRMKHKSSPCSFHNWLFFGAFFWSSAVDHVGSQISLSQLCFWRVDEDTHFLWCKHDQSWSIIKPNLLNVWAEPVPGQIHSIHVGHWTTWKKDRFQQLICRVKKWHALWPTFNSLSWCNRRHQMRALSPTL